MIYSHYVKLYSENGKQYTQALLKLKKFNKV